MLKSRIETALAVLFAGMALLTAFWPDWIETVFRVDPDGGNGSAEWLVVIVLGVAAIVAFILARRDYRTARATASPSPHSTCEPGTRRAAACRDGRAWQVQLRTSRAPCACQRISETSVQEMKMYDMPEHLRGPASDLIHGWHLPAPLLDISQVNGSPWTNPASDTSAPDWSSNVVQGQLFDGSAAHKFQWVSVLSPAIEQDDEVGVAGTAVNPEMSRADLPFSHPFGFKAGDWEFTTAPDAAYTNLLGAANKDQTDLKTYRQDWAAAVAAGIPVPSGLLGVEIDGALIPPAYRVEQGDRVAVYGRASLRQALPGYSPGQLHRPPSCRHPAPQEPGPGNGNDAPAGVQLPLHRQRFLFGGGHSIACGAGQRTGDPGAQLRRVSGPARSFAERSNPEHRTAARQCARRCQSQLDRRDLGEIEGKHRVQHLRGAADFTDPGPGERRPVYPARRAPQQFAGHRHEPAFPCHRRAVLQLRHDRRQRRWDKPTKRKLYGCASSALLRKHAVVPQITPIMNSAPEAGNCAKANFRVPLI